MAFYPRELTTHVLDVYLSVGGFGRSGRPRRYCPQTTEVTMSTGTLKIAQTTKTTKTTKPARKPRVAKSAQLAQKIVAGWAGSAGLAVLGLSVTHVAHAIQAITGEYGGSIALAIGIDCGMVACEVVSVVCGDCEEAVKWAKWVVYGTLGLSAGLNAWAFSANAATWVLWGLAIALGVLCPFLTFGLFKVTTAAWQHATSR